MRRQRPRGSTTREAVIDAALAVIDRVGADELTIRGVAKAAGVPPMSLYSHFSNKNELLALVYVEVSRRLYPEREPTTWQADLLALCVHVRRVLIEHPRWVPLLSRPAAPFVPPIRERILKLMVDDGMSPADGMAALTSATMATIGLALVEVQLRDPDGQAAMSKRYERLATWSESTPDHDHPITRSALLKLRRLNLEDNFLIAIRALIAGLDVNRTRRSSE